MNRFIYLECLTERLCLARAKMALAEKLVNETFHIFARPIGQSDHAGDRRQPGDGPKQMWSPVVMELSAGSSARKRTQAGQAMPSRFRSE
jgi:hypothetical protein